MNNRTFYDGRLKTANPYQEREKIMSFEVTGNSFIIAGKPAFLLSGEIHYFRVAPEKWDTHLEKLKKCGASVASTYIPWSWHEPREGSYDFTGSEEPTANLVGWLEAIKKKGLFAIVKPGPYMLAEYEDRGIPTWLTAHKEILAKHVDMVTSLHPLFLERTKIWYDHILEVLRPYQISMGGPIIMMQVCNEIGLFNWLAGSSDYSETVAREYRKFLKNRFMDIEELNRAYGEDQLYFDLIELPEKPPSTLPELTMWMDFHEFQRVYFADYLGLLEKEMRARGITVPFYHNIAGWVYGHALEYPVNISMYTKIAQESPTILLAADHIPEYVNYRNIHHGSLVTKAIGALKNGRELSYVAEMQSGTREVNVQTYPVEMELFYKKCIADGVKGMNLYMFSQGRNPDRKGAYGPTFYWQTALDAEGKELPLYDHVSRLGKILKAFGPSIGSAQRKADLAVAIYWPYWQTEMFYPVFEKKTRLNPGELGLDFDPKNIRETMLVDCWLKLLSWKNIECDFVDLQTVTDEKLGTYKKVMVLTMPYMDSLSQEKLTHYAEQGGSLFFSPALPRWDLTFQPCTLLADTFGLEQGELLTPPKVDLLNHHSVACQGPLYSIKAMGDFITLATSERGTHLCGLEKKHGKGSFTCLSAPLPHMTEEQGEFFYHLLDKSGIKPSVVCSPPGLMASFLQSERGAWLFAGNIHSGYYEGTITIPGIIDEEIPLTLAPKASLLTPVMTALAGGKGRIIYSTADILGVKQEKENHLELEMYRERGATSQIVLEPGFTVSSVTCGGKAVSFTAEGDEKVKIVLAHSGKVEKIILS
jgi:beta-galactosidase